MRVSHLSFGSTNNAFSVTFSFAKDGTGENILDVMMLIPIIVISKRYMHFVAL
jgi:hypothetical protein